MQNIETVILKSLTNNEEYFRRVIPHIKKDYFTNEHRSVYDIFLQFVSEYSKLPTPTILEVEFQKSIHANRPNATEVLGLIRQLKENAEVEYEWLLNSTEKWCKDRAVYLAIMESIEIIDGKNTKKAEGAIPEILSNALGVSFDSNVGHDYIENAKDRFEFYHREEDKMSFDIEMLNTITKGGVSKKTLNVILAGTGTGKSLAMCHFASAALAEGKNVLYITLEMSEEKIAERIDANLFDVNIADIESMDEDQFNRKIDSIAKKTHGKLVIKEYPTASAHAGHFRALLDELKLKKNFKPHVIFVDYLNIAASSRMKGLGGSINSYTYVKAIAEELRGLAVEFDVPLWSATQVTRTGFGNSDVDITDTSESFGLPATCDMMLALISTEQLEGMNQVMVKQLKNRYNDLNKNKRFVVGLDRSKMRLYDVEDSAQTLADDSTTANNSSNVAFGANKASRNDDFSSFKM